MRHHHTYSITQAHIYPFTTNGIRETQTRITARHAPRVPAVILGLVLGIGLGFMLALSSAWLPPLTRALAEVATFAEPSTAPTLPSEELENMGLDPALFDDIFLRP
jgi:hypothetical protein